jgi:hypothetical protein
MNHKESVFLPQGYILGIQKETMGELHLSDIGVGRVAPVI